MLADLLVLPRRAALLVVSAVVFPFAVRSQGRHEQQFPDVLAVNVLASGNDRFDFDVTISSPYDTPSRYADGFHVTTAGGEVLGERQLLHDHANEQPFTRELRSVLVAPAVRAVVVQARDKKNGYGGRSALVRLPGR